MENNFYREPSFKNTIYLFMVVVLIISCDKGISPEPQNIKPGFSGKIIFVGDWDTNVTRTHIILFKEDLTDSTKFSIDNLAYISEEIPFSSDVYNYTSLENSVIQNILPGEYEYLAVIQSEKENISFKRSDWFVVGLYSENNQIPKALVIREGVLDGVDISVNFNNPPPQPPGGTN